MHVDGNANLTTGHTYQINDTQIALANLSDGLSHASGHIQSGADEIDGDLIDIDYAQTNYTPATTGVATDVNHLAAHLEGIDNALGASGAGTIAGMTDSDIATPAGGHLLIYDGADSWDNKVISGAIEITSGGVTSLTANSVDSAAYVDGSIDLAHMSADSVDSAQYVDGSIDLVHMSANSVDSDQYVDGSIDAVHLAESYADVKADTNMLSWIFDASATTATKEEKAVKIPVGVVWTSASSRCDATPGTDPVFTVYYHSDGSATLASLDTFTHDAASMIDSEDITDWTSDPVAGSYIGVDLTTAATTATYCTFTLTLTNN